MPFQGAMPSLSAAGLPGAHLSVGVTRCGASWVGLFYDNPRTVPCGHANAGPQEAHILILHTVKVQSACSAAPLSLLC